MRLTSPGPTIGVVGGGQLGRMLGEAAAPLGFEVVVVDPTPDAPASPVVRDQIVGSYDDHETLLELAEQSDFLTFEIELADPDALEEVSDETGVPVHPSPDTLRVIEDKLVQKRHLEDAGVPVPEFRKVDSVDDLMEVLDELGCPAMLKARQGGYDGRGNVPIDSPEDARDAFEAVGGNAMVEEFVDYDRELSVIGCIGHGTRDVFPVTETVHEDEILRETVSPARTSDEVISSAREIAHDVLEVMEGRGVYGIEMFEADGEVLLNEIAPRPHNSGHWTIEGAVTSQFEQHVRAVTGCPLGSTDLRGTTVSANILGDVDSPRQPELEGVENLLSTDCVHLHWYGKRTVRHLRKMGHFTVTGDESDDPNPLLDTARSLKNELVFR